MAVNVNILLELTVCRFEIIISNCELSKVLSQLKALRLRSISY